MILAALLVVSPSTGAALAQDAHPKTGVVDVQRVLLESEAGKPLLRSIELKRH